MTDTLMEIIGIFLAVLIMFIFPVVAIASQHDEIAQTTVEVAVADFVNTISEKGKVTQFDYNQLVQKISATGNNFDVQIELQVLDDNPERKSVTTDKTVKGENLYYSVYTENITNKIMEKIGKGEDGEYNLKKDDYIIVTVKNTNVTIGTQFKNMFYQIIGKDAYTISASSSALVTSSGKEDSEPLRGGYVDIKEEEDVYYTDINVYVTRKSVSISNTDMIFILDASGSLDNLWGTSYSDITNSCIEILNIMISQGMVNNFYIGFVQFSDAAHSATNEIGNIRNASELPSFINTLRSKYGHKAGAGTYYALGFKKAQEIISRDLAGRKNRRVIVFMTDGIPQDSGGLEELKMLKNVYGVDSFYAIAFDLPRYSGAVDTEILEKQASIFAPNAKVLKATNSTLTATFKNILYQINVLQPELQRTNKGLLELTNIEISNEKPMEIIIKKSGTLIKELKITSYPTSTSGVIYIKDSKMYLDIDNLAKECMLEDFNDVDVNISYFVK